jgi:hypothetical protein
MTLAEFNASLTTSALPHNLAPAMQSMWWAAKGDWAKAHGIVMKDDSREAAWVHAYLHRVEGDLPNASYWYRTAGKPVARGTLEAEWAAIAGALLGGGA